MKMKLTFAASAILLVSAPLAAENVNGFENFVISRNDSAPSQPVAIADFSSRTHTEDAEDLDSFNSKKPCGSILSIR